MRNICEGEGSTTGLGKCPSMPVGLQVPGECVATEEISEERDDEREDEQEEDIVMVVDAGNIEPLEPKSLAEARRHFEWPQWEKGIQEELKMLEDAGMWELADLPDGANILGSKWVFRIKEDKTSTLR